MCTIEKGNNSAECTIVKEAAYVPVLWECSQAVSLYVLDLKSWR